MLWLALYFPLLPLEALSLRRSPSAVAVRGRVLTGDTAAIQAGVVAGQRLATALGICPGLAVFERDEARERRALEALACWAGRFTPNLVLSPHQTLLLEIGGCLRLFGGIPAIVEGVLEGCTTQAYSVTWAVAPTPLGAAWLARAGQEEIHPSADSLQAALARLPCRVPGWPAEIVQRLAAFGMQVLGDLLPLPTAALRRRIGNQPVDDCLRARGELPDPQTLFVFPESFSSQIELPSRVEHAEALIFAGQRLFSALAGWLCGRQYLVRVCTLHLQHDDRTESALVLRLGEPSADEGRLLRLLREHLGQLQLTAPVEGLRLVADELSRLGGDSGQLFVLAAAGEGVLACLERLRARLGEAAVQAMVLRADYRPESASGRHDVLADSHLSAEAPPALVLPRPLWLLPDPQPLTERADGPHWHGPLQLLSRAERLESGWWDEGEGQGDVRRDYFVARNRQGQWAWVFRDAQGWYLHGLFA